MVVKALSFKAMTYYKKVFWGFILGVSAFGYGLGLLGYGEPVLTYVLILVYLPGLLNIAILATLDLMKSRGDLPSLEVFLGYVKRLSMPFIVLGMVICLPWTFIWVLYIRAHPLYAIPTLPLVSALLYLIAIVTLCVFSVGSLTYFSTRIVDPQYRDLFKTGKLGDDMRSSSLHLQLLALPIIMFLLLDGPILYALDVLVGREYFPDPDLLLNITALWVIMVSLVLGLVLLRKSEQVVAKAIAEHHATAAAAQQSQT
ncbi:MAG: hypothetical protein ACTSYL_01035 [Candidatus Thorarchaeota archaeon]